jgi:hypothetical protein
VPEKTLSNIVATVVSGHTSSTVTRTTQTLCSSFSVCDGSHICLQAYCTGHAGRNEPSFGRRKRELNETDSIEDQKDATNTTEEEEQVREMIEVYYLQTCALEK